MMKLNITQVIKDLEHLVDKYGENGSYNTYCTLRDALALIGKLVDENEFHRKTISENAQMALNVTVDEIEKTRADTVRKMQEKIRSKSEYGTINISPWQLDQIAKEVLEENK